MWNPDLGAFSVSLAVRDLARSRAFYEALGFTVTGGEPDRHWLIMQRGACIIGLFQGMFEKNILTFNPGLVIRAEPLEAASIADFRLDDFTDIRDIQRYLLARGLELTTRVDEATNPDGPASLTLEDPDGNPILIDQFFERPSSR